ncbi:hypothetical protein EDD38_7330 [Kitasatospora cineracea]|uniref:Uncharacterized protein n=1 Tax=Kitasatospora cineracea TaxID=88074 RepID=A0A3N4RM27_9ACTN|nr:hypothetical protein EDD38_7330 [Kitasatospora cineracea]
MCLHAAADQLLIHNEARVPLEALAGPVPGSALGCVFGCDHFGDLPSWCGLVR